MPNLSGFVQRVKGRTAEDSTFIGRAGAKQYVNTIDVSVQSTTIPNSGHTILKASSLPAIIRLDAPIPGVEKTITVTTVSSGHISVWTNSTTTVFFDGVNAVWNPSTIAAQQVTLCLMGVSTTAWSNLGVNPVVTSTGGSISNGGLSNSS